jgi:ligand-binding SRPBCC domain-containing protein
MQPPTYFKDTMLEGTFRSMRHDHSFHALPNGRTEMKDDFFFAAPMPLAGPLAEVLFLRGYMQRLLRERNAVIKRIAESRSEWQRYLP